jgi:hypothetical protein
VTLNGDALALIGTGNSMELTTAYLVLYRIEMSSNSIYSGWIAHKHYTIGQELWLQMQMETRAVLIDNQF